MIEQHYIWLDGRITRFEYRTEAEAKHDGVHPFVWIRDVLSEATLSPERKQDIIRDVATKRRACAKAHKATWTSAREADGHWHSWCQTCGLQIQYGFNPL